MATSASCPRCCSPGWEQLANSWAGALVLTPFRSFSNSSCCSSHRDGLVVLRHRLTDHVGEFLAIVAAGCHWHDAAVSTENILMISFLWNWGRPCRLCDEAFNKRSPRSAEGR